MERKETETTREKLVSNRRKRWRRRRECESEWYMHITEEKVTFEG